MSPIIRRTGEEFTIPSKYLLLILSLVSCALMIITFKTSLFTGPLNSFSGIFIVPFQNGITTVGTYLKDQSDKLAEITRLQDENARLKDEVSKLTMENSDLKKQQYDLTEFRELNDLKDQYSDYRNSMVAANVIGKEDGNWYHSFIIDKGSDDGIEVDMNVLANGGLVGRVTNVGPKWARVLSIISDNSSLAAEDRSSKSRNILFVHGDLKTYKDGVITFSKLNDIADEVAVGDEIVTSNISDKYLSGILVGHITEIKKDADNLTKVGKISPVADFDHLNLVLVIKEKKEDHLDDYKNQKNSN
ncbi:MAG: rod shape-determining protein MreC [Butyrivibrio sp.]|nr:rod shape-determining protein MreC [Butyrivibrio sp.]